jgi:hypothetical protein
MFTPSMSQFLLTVILCFPLSLASTINVFKEWKLDTVISETVPAGSYGDTFRVTLPVDTNGNINFGVIRVDVNQTGNHQLSSGRSMLYLSTSQAHWRAGIGPAWPVPRYSWALSSSGIASITRCETDPTTGKQHSAGNNELTQSGFLVEETSSTTAFCLPKLQIAREKPLSQLDDSSVIAQDAPSNVCQCIGESSNTKYLYVRSRCYGSAGQISDCKFTASISTTCPLGTAATPKSDGKCRLCEVDTFHQNPASIVETFISGGSNTIATAQCLSKKTCPAGTYFVGFNAINSYTPKSSKSTSTRKLDTEIYGGRCEPCPQHRFSVENSTSCDYKVDTCPSGTYADWRNRACVSCPKGKWSGEEGATTETTCVPCGKGKFSNLKGATTSHQCFGCPLDTYNDVPASSRCKACEDGKLTLRPKSSGLGKLELPQEKYKTLSDPKGSISEKVCKQFCREQSPCKKGEKTNKCCRSYEISQGKKACRVTPCPTDAICEQDIGVPPKVKSCLNSKYYLRNNCFETCPPGYTGIGFNTTGRTCVEAHNATSSTSLREPNRCRKLCLVGQHYTEIDGVSVCIDCEGGAEWCVGTWECLGDRTADGCIKCKENFYEVQRVCTPCPKNAVASLIIVMIVLILVLSLLFVFAGTSRPETSLSGLMIFLGHIQIQGYLLRFSINWPPEFVWFMRLLSSIFTLDIPALVPAPECSFKWSTEAKYFSSMASMPMLLLIVWIPVLMTTLYVGFCECKGCVFCRPKKRKKKCTVLESAAVHKAVAVSTLILTVMYGFISPASTELGLCAPRAGASNTALNKHFMKSDPSVECLWYHYFLATCFGLLYSMGIPLSIAVFLYWGRNQGTLWDEEHWIPDHVGWIYLRFEHSVFWWEIINMSTKTIIGVTERAGAGGGEAGLMAQLIVTFIVLTLSLALQIYFRPYASMISRADVIYQDYKFTIRGGKKSHGVHFEELDKKELGIAVSFVNEDAKYAPVADDEFQGINDKSDVNSAPKAHHMRMGDIVTHIDGMRLPHVYMNAKKRTMAEVLHIKKDRTTVEAQV